MVKENKLHYTLGQLWEMKGNSRLFYKHADNGTWYEALTAGTLSQKAGFHTNPGTFDFFDHIPTDYRYVEVRPNSLLTLMRG